MATGMFFIPLGKPRMEDFWEGNGDEVEFGGGYQELGSYNEEGFKHAVDLWRFGSDAKTFVIPEGKDLKVGQWVRVDVPNHYRDAVVVFRRLSSHKVKELVRKLPQV